MELITDGEYLLAKQDDGNTVVYRNGVAIWDKWSYEASLGISTPSIPNTPIPLPSNPSSPLLIERNVNPIGMSYWRNINQHRNQSILKVFLSINDEITIFSIDKSNLQVLGVRKLGIHHTGEGCYFSALDPSLLYVTMDSRLLAVNIDTGENKLIWRSEGNNLWQCHSSYDEKVHSATIKDADYNIIAWGVFDGAEKHFTIGTEPDECQIDKSGKYLLIKENDYNRIINVEDGIEVLLPRRGRLGHSDCGFDCALGEVDYRAGGVDLITLSTQERRELFTLGIWNLGYVSFALNQEFFLVSASNNQLIKIQMNGNFNVVCDLMTENQEYNNRPKANLCPEGEYAVWTAFVNGTLNAYLVRV